MVNLNIAPKVSSETQNQGVLKNDRKCITPEAYEVLNLYEKQNLL